MLQLGGMRDNQQAHCGKHQDNQQTVARRPVKIQQAPLGEDQDNQQAVALKPVENVASSSFRFGEVWAEELTNENVWGRVQTSHGEEEDQ